MGGGAAKYKTTSSTKRVPREERASHWLSPQPLPDCFPKNDGNVCEEAEAHEYASSRRRLLDDFSRHVPEAGCEDSSDDRQIRSQQRPSSAPSLIRKQSDGVNEFNREPRPSTASTSIRRRNRKADVDSKLYRSSTASPHSAGSTDTLRRPWTAARPSTTRSHRPPLTERLYEHVPGIGGTVPNTHARGSDLLSSIEWLSSDQQSQADDPDKENRDETMVSRPRVGHNRSARREKKGKGYGSALLSKAGRDSDFVGRSSRPKKSFLASKDCEWHEKNCNDSHLVLVTTIASAYPFNPQQKKQLILNERVVGGLKDPTRQCWGKIEVMQLGPPKICCDSCGAFILDRTMETPFYVCKNCRSCGRKLEMCLQCYAAGVMATGPRKSEQHQLRVACCPAQKKGGFFEAGPLQFKFQQHDSAKVVIPSPIKSDKKPLRV